MDNQMTSQVPTQQLDEEDAEFIERARSFLAGFGVNRAALDPDVDLVDAEVLDSLLLLAFLAFVEEQGGVEQLEPQDIIAIRKLRTASALVRARKLSPVRQGD